jgi:diguanylate cyclase (GGDEF)-like protein
LGLSAHGAPPDRPAYLEDRSTVEPTVQGDFVAVSLVTRRRRTTDRELDATVIRLRFGLSWLPVAVLPVVVAATAKLVIAPRPGRDELLLALLAASLLIFTLLTVWLGNRVVRSTEQLAESRAELRRVYDAVRVDALVDPLTRLGNHRSFQEECERMVQHATRYHSSLALVLLDVDNFKQLNDGSGHAAGDDLLRQFATFLGASLRRSDRAFRIGGDEFAILMPKTDENGGLAATRRLLAAALQPNAAARPDRPVSFSAGISAVPKLGMTRAEVYAQADAALQSAKRKGRTQVERYDPTVHQVPGKNQSGEVSTAIKVIAEQRALRPVYQPIVELATGRVIGYEGLVRPAPSSGFANAGALFAAAEAVGRTVELDKACLEVVAGAAASRLRRDQFLSINLSARSLEAPDFTVARLLTLLVGLGVRPQQVVLELTERLDPENVEHLRRRIAALRETGVRIAADDLGAGNAGLRLLSEIEFDVVKVDLSLVQGGPIRDSSLDVLRSIAGLAGRRNALVIAEGIETQDELRLVRALGMDAGQGYLLAQPGEGLDLERIDLEALAADDYWIQRLVRVAEEAAVGEVAAERQAAER